MDEFFDFAFVGLPHKIYAPKDCTTGTTSYNSPATDDLRERFVDKSRPDFLLQNKYKRGIPADGFCAYASQVWDTVLHNKDLDLPDQFRLLATFRYLVC